MSVYESTLAAANYQGAENIANHAGLQVDSTMLELIVRDDHRVVGQMYVTAERDADGWTFTGRIPGWAMS